MASEEAEKSSTASANHPSYPEMIVAAIRALDEDGSTGLEISEYMESTYPGLPPTHSDLLKEHLHKLFESGDLIIENSLFKLAPKDTKADIPRRRGRGRPPKPKTGIPPVKGPPRPRGRPPKPKDPTAAVTVPKPRGRPPKAAKVAAPPKPKSSRPRGRPPKAKTAAIAPRVPVTVAEE